MFLFVFRYFPKVFDILKFIQLLFQNDSLCQYQHFCFTITCNACHTDYLHCISPNQLISRFNTHLRQLCCVCHRTVLIIEEDTWQQGSPRALAVSTTFVCLEPEDGLAPDNNHWSIYPLFFSQAPSWHQAIMASRLSFKLSIFRH